MNQIISRTFSVYLQHIVISASYISNRFSAAWGRCFGAVIFIGIAVFWNVADATAQEQLWSKQGVQELRRELEIPTNEQLLQLSPKQSIALLDAWLSQMLKRRSEQEMELNLALVDDIGAYAKEADSDYLRFMEGLLRFAVIRVSGMQMYDAIEQMQLLEKQAKEAQLDWLSAEINRALSVYYAYSSKEPEKAVWHIKTCCELLKGKDPIEFPRVTKSLSELGSIYLQFGDLESSLFYTKEALRLLPPTQTLAEKAHLCNNLGCIYREKGDLDSSDFYFEGELKTAAIIQDSIQWGLAHGNLGENQYLRGNYDAAAPLLQIDAAMALKFDDWGVAANALMLLSNIHVKGGDLATAKDLLQRAETCLRRTNQKNRLGMLYNARVKYYAAIGDYASMLLNLDSIQLQQDKMDSTRLRSNVMRIEPLFALHQQQLHAAEFAESILRKEKNRVQIIMGLIIALFVVLIVLLLFRRRSRRDIDSIMAEKKSVEERLLTANVNLESFLKAIADRNSDYKKGEARALKTEVIETVGGHQNLDKLASMVLLTHQNWADFSRLFEEVHPGFLVRLSQRYPEITQAEIRFLALLRLDIDTESMRTILAVGPESIRQARHRLRKKMQLSQGDNIREVIGRL